MVMSEVPSGKAIIYSYIAALVVYALLISSIVVIKDVNMFLITYMLALLIPVVCGIVVYLDARKIDNLGKARGIKVFRYIKPGGWGAITFVATIIAVPIYLHIRKKAISKLS